MTVTGTGTVTVIVIVEETGKKAVTGVMVPTIGAATPVVPMVGLRSHAAPPGAPVQE